VFNDRRTRHDDKLFIALIAIPAIFAVARYFETRSELDQIALQNKPPVVAVAKVPPAQPQAMVAAASVHRF
jgi:hypothetical protein